MGFLATIAGPVADHFEDAPYIVVIVTAVTALLLIILLVNVITQLLFKDPTKPPLVFHWFPFIGSTISYGIDPIAFFTSCRRKVSFLLFLLIVCN
jgi:hypothetical protein